MTLNETPGTPATPFTVVLTRPAGQSAALIEKLAARGLGVLDFPLLGIEALDDDAPLRAALGALERYALVIFVSPNAVEWAFARHRDARGDVKAWPRTLPVAAVGPSSVAALARHGLAAPGCTIISPGNTAGDTDDSASICPARFDSEALYDAIEKTLGAHALQGRRVLIVRGDGGRAWLANRLREAGAEVETVAAYRRVMPQPSLNAWARVRALLGGEAHAWVLTSSEGVRNLDALARAHLSAHENAALRRATLVAPHARIAETAHSLGFCAVTLSGPGDESIESTLVLLANVVQSA